MSERGFFKKRRLKAEEALRVVTVEITNHMQSFCVAWDFIFNTSLTECGSSYNDVKRHYTKQLSRVNAVMVEFLEEYSEYD